MGNWRVNSHVRKKNNWNYFIYCKEKPELNALDGQRYVVNEEDGYIGSGEVGKVPDEFHGPIIKT